MARIATIRLKDTGEVIYPRTETSAIIDFDGGGGGDIELSDNSETYDDSNWAEL